MTTIWILLLTARTTNSSRPHISSPLHHGGVITDIRCRGRRAANRSTTTMLPSTPTSISLRGGGGEGEGEGGTMGSSVEYDGVVPTMTHVDGREIMPMTTMGGHPDDDFESRYHADVGDAAAASTYGDHPTYNEYRETVEDRIDAWRRQQQQLQRDQSVLDATSAVDEQGRLKLFSAVSRASVSFFFFILMWRTVHHYELADATFSSSSRRGGGGGSSLLRMIVVTPLVVLFLGEMMGAILGLTGGLGIGGGGGGNASQSTKRRLKGVLNLHKIVELSMIIYNVFRLAIWPSRYVMREVYIGRTIANFFFLMQAQLYTKLSWDEVSKSAIGEGGYVTESYYDDYTPDMGMGGGNYYEGDSLQWQQSTNSGTHYVDDVPTKKSPQQYYDDANSDGWS
ncbi:hypothetical protein ACHAXA_000634 [Cyclostephanos tholiformis]|uniref:Uncharacterized protein n=1 Tax=Cyclostephanos tholiformis TaxID=382380 RepID=A0ABD3SQR7_9STRA